MQQDWLPWKRHQEHAGTKERPQDTQREPRRVPPETNPDGVLILELQPPEH